MTQDDLAVQLFVTRQTVSRWERGHSYPTIDTLVKLSRLLDFSLDYALLGDGEMVDKVAKDQKQAARNKKIVVAVGVFILLTGLWGLVNYFNLNTRDAPVSNYSQVEVVGDRILYTMDDDPFWVSCGAMTEFVDDGKTAEISMYQSFRFTNIFRHHRISIFPVYISEDEDIQKIKISGTNKTFPVKAKKIQEAKD